MPHRVANFFDKIVKAIPIILTKIGTILMLIFVVGMIAGYLVFAMGLTPAIFLIPIVAMFVMWYRLDEGVLLLILLALLVIVFPELFNDLFSAFL